jgi:capsular exopolysaccharide synthesis family protein
LADQVDLKVKATRAATAWLSRRVEELRHELEASEEAVQRFRREADLLETSPGDTMVAQQLADLNSQLTSARDERLQLEARLQSIREISKNGRDFQAFSDILDSPTIQALRAQLAQATAEIERSEGILGRRHPTQLALESQVASLSRQLTAEIERARRRLEDEVVAARNKEEHLSAVLHRQKSQYGEGGEAVVHLDQLRREADANRALYETLLNRYKQTLDQDTLATAEARLISQAVPPGSPSGPRKLPILLLGLAIGTATGVALAVLLEWLDRSVRRISDIEETAGIPVFGLLPTVPRGGVMPQELVLDGPRSPFSEALRRSLVALQLSHDPADLKVIMVTSATAGESKTIFCVAAARALALTGVRVLVVDADLRRPGVAAAFGCKADVHIGDVIRGGVPARDAVRKDARSGAQFVAAVSGGGDPQVLLDSEGFAALIDWTRERYDLVIVDTPPLLDATDAASVGMLADANLLLVRWGKTPHTVVMAALRFLSLCRIAVDGMILTRVDLRRFAKYGDTPESIPYRRTPSRTRSTAAGLEPLPPRFPPVSLGLRASSSERQD